MARTDPHILLEKAAKVRLLVLDVDGVMTDGRIVYTTDGAQIHSFHVHDGLGVKLLMTAGVDVAVISSRTSSAVERRVRELGIGILRQGVSGKLPVYEEIRDGCMVHDEEVCAVGDDWVDLPVLLRVGLSVAVRDARPPLQDYVDYVTGCPGGGGAVREVCDLILRARQAWGKCLEPYLGA